MNLLEAIKSGRPFRRRAWKYGEWMHVRDGLIRTSEGMSHDWNDFEDLTAEDYELKPREAREWDNVIQIHSAGFLPQGFAQGIHVREILSGEVVVTREKLWGAWANSFPPNCELPDNFNHFCKALGLEDA